MEVNSNRLLFHWALWPLHINLLSVQLALLALALGALADAALALLALLLEIDLAAGAGGEVCEKQRDIIKIGDKSAAHGDKSVAHGDDPSDKSAITYTCSWSKDGKLSATCSA